MTDQEGRFTLRGITPGDYRIFAWEDIEPFAYFDAAVVKQYEAAGKTGSHSGVFGGNGRSPDHPGGDTEEEKIGAWPRFFSQGRSERWSKTAPMITSPFTSPCR